MRKFRLLFTGDTVISTQRQINFDENLKKVLDTHDVICCNYEAPVITKYSTPSEDPDCKLGQSMVGLSTLVEAGFNLFALANNHIMGYGADALENTIGAIRNLGARTIGAGMTWDDVYRPYIVSVDGLRVGIINIGERQFGTADQYGGCGYAWLGNYRVNDQIRNLQKRCNRVIAVVHAGLENVDVPLPEWREYYKHLIDDGVDAVIAHHPHVMQGWEDYHDGRIYYSLGNFLWECPSVASCMNPAFVVSMTITPTGINYEEIPVIYKEGNISICQDNVVVQYMKSLCDVLQNKNEYIKFVNKGCAEVYRKWYKIYPYCVVHQYEWNGWKNIIKNIYSFIRYGWKVDERRLYLLSVSETFRYTVSRGIPLENNWQERKNEKL
ncbi:CapA family protein [Selenomonas ruminantium]|uniref:CapA family protein n=1 Tax=Selenomonas ruminantium TaxID=971 RepID=UPI0026EF8BD2|nr:CapA family protein [Selenomonas ruminantium]